MTGTCDCCQAPEVELHEAKHMRYGSEERLNICYLCGSTFTFNAYCYPDQYAAGPLYRTTCFIGNAILKEIRDGRKIRM